MPRPVVDILNEIAEYALTNPLDKVVPLDDVDRGEAGYRAKGVTWTFLIRDLRQFCSEGTDNRSYEVERCFKTPEGRQQLPQILADFARPIQEPVFEPAVSRYQRLEESFMPSVHETMLDMAKYIRKNPDCTIYGSDDPMRRAFRWYVRENPSQTWEMTLTSVMNLESEPLRKLFKDSATRATFITLLRSHALEEENDEKGFDVVSGFVGEVPPEPPPPASRNRFELMDDDF